MYFSLEQREVLIVDVPFSQERERVRFGLLFYQTGIGIFDLLLFAERASEISYFVLANNMLFYLFQTHNWS